MFKNRKRLLTVFLGFSGIMLLTAVVLAMIYFDISFTSTSGSCSLSGTYTKYIYSDGYYEWSPNPPSSATLSVSGTAEGLGNASVTLVSGHVNFSPADGGTRGGQVGQAGRILQFPLIPVWKERSESWSVSDDFSDLPLSQGTYEWEVKGKFETEAFFWNGVEWKEAVKTNDEKTFSGTWQIVHKNVASTLCKRSGCNDVVASPYTHKVFCHLYMLQAHFNSYPTGRYWICNESEVNLHKPRTCVRCGYTFHNCIPQQCRNYPSSYCSETY